MRAAYEWHELRRYLRSLLARRESRILLFATTDPWLLHDETVVAQAVEAAASRRGPCMLGILHAVKLVVRAWSQCTAAISPYHTVLRAARAPVVRTARRLAQAEPEALSSRALSTERAHLRFAPDCQL